MQKIITELLGKNVTTKLGISSGALFIILYLHADAKQYADEKIKPFIQHIIEIKESLIRIEERQYQIIKEDK